MFTYFAVPPALQRRTRVYGVLGAIALRIVMILIGAWLIATLHWIIYVFGLFLLIAGAKMLFFAGDKPDLENPALRWMRSQLPVTPGFQGERYWVMQSGVRTFTSLFLALGVVQALIPASIVVSLVVRPKPGS